MLGGGINAQAKILVRSQSSFKKFQKPSLISAAGSNSVQENSKHEEDKMTKKHKEVRFEISDSQFKSSKQEFA